MIPSSRPHYNTRNIEACATHLLRWTPFAHSSSRSGTPKSDSEPFPYAAPVPAPTPIPAPVPTPIPAPVPAPVAFSIALEPEAGIEYGEAVDPEQLLPGSMPDPVPAPHADADAGGGSWSKRQKQLSRALARGLWRWKEGFHARKRRRRSSRSIISRSGSSRSSDAKASHSFMFVSDPSASDFLLRPDSSGELFFLHSSSGDFLGVPPHSTTTIAVSGPAFPPLPPFVPSDSELRHGLDCLSLNKQQQQQPPHHATMDSCTCSDALSVDSGYGSEPGYCGDGEIGYGDDALTDELDEEDTREVLRKFWKDAAPFIKDVLPDALLLSRSLKDQKGMHHRLRRRRRHDLRRGGAQWTKHLS